MRTLRSAAVATLLAAATLAPAALVAQDLHPSRRPSPLGLARMLDGDAYVKIHYSRPYKRDRDNIFGTAESKALVPFGERWRLGANEATELTTTHDLVFGDQKLPAGTYSVFATPGPDSWKIHFNTRLGLSGTGFFDMATGKFEAVDLDSSDILVLEAPVTMLDEKDEVDQFTIAIKRGDAGAAIEISWIRTRVSVPFRVGR